MQKKLGPLKLWQWALIGAITGLTIYLYRRSRTPGVPTIPSPADAGAAVSPTQGVVDPTTGTTTGNPGLDTTGDPTVPVPLSELLGLAASQGGSNAGGTLQGGDSGSQQANTQPNTGPTLDQELANTGTVLDLLEHLQNLTNPPPAQTTGTVATSVATGQQRPPKPADPAAGGHYTWVPSRNQWVLIHWQNGKWTEGPVPPPKTKTTHPSNPGHTITNHGGGKKTVSSSAPTNGRQHQNVQPPNHQRHNPNTNKGKPPSHPAKYKTPVRH